MNATRIIKIWSRSHGALTAVRAAPTPVPGLFVNEDPGVRGYWNLTHLATGCAVAAGLDSPEQALDLAVRLGSVCDWTLPGVAIAALGPQIRAALRREGALPATGQAMPVLQFAAMEPLS